MEYLALEFGEPRPFVHTGWQPSEDGKTYVAPGTPSLPAYKPKRVTELMAEHVAEDLSLDQLAVQVGLSNFISIDFSNAPLVSRLRGIIELRLKEA